MKGGVFIMDNKEIALELTKLIINDSESTFFKSSDIDSKSKDIATAYNNILDKLIKSKDVQIPNNED
jgi:hypothetical protein